MRIHTLIGLTILLMALAPANAVAQSAHDPRPRINRVDPAEPIVGQSFEVYGDHFGSRQGRWVLYLYRPAPNGDTLTYDLSIISWQNQLIRAKLPDGIPASSALPAGTRYRLHIVVRGRLLQSNHFYLSVANATRPAVISRAGEPWIRAIYRDGVREQLWIYGEFPPIPYTGGDARGIPHGIELLIRRPGESTRTPMTIVSWHRKRMVAYTALGCNSSGTNLVEFRTGTNPVHRSNEAPVMLDNIWCWRTSEETGRRFMHIEGVEVEGTPGGSAPPRYPRPGDWLDIFGTGFGDLWEPELRISEGKRVVELVRGVHGRAQVIEPRALTIIRAEDPNPPNYRMGDPITTRLQWSDFHILVEIPRDIVPDEYIVSVYDKLARRRSNNVRVRIVARESPHR